MPVERRRSERALTRGRLWLRLGNEVAGAVTLDASAHDARVVTNLVLNPGQVVEVVHYKGKVRSESARVVWVNVAGSEPPIEAGLEFLD
jgi:hypothetical protein